MRILKYYPLAFVFVLLTLLSACVTNKYTAPEIRKDGLYRDAKAGDTTTMATLPWKTLFSDETLQQLITEGINNNLDLKQAVERLKIAEAAFTQSRQALLPTLQGDVNVTDAKQSARALNFPPGIVPLNTITYRAQLSTVWEADIWGKLSSAKRSAYALLLQSEAAKRAVQTQLIANIANTYYQLLALDKQLAITQQTISIRSSDVNTMKALKESAIVTGAAVVQSEANLYAAQVTLPDLKRGIREAEHVLSILVARPAGSIARGNLDAQQPYTQLSTGLSAQLLQHRPDVQAAELAFRSAFEQTNVARTNFYPSLTITAAGGLSTLQLKNFFDNSIFYNLIGGLTQPIFNRGLNKARLKTAQAQQRIALYGLQQSLLTGGQEVSNALYAYEAAAEKQTARRQQIASLIKAVDYTKELLRYSSATNFTDVLTSEQSLLAAQLAGINDNLQQLQAVVNLYRALGGGTE